MMPMDPPPGNVSPPASHADPVPTVNKQAGQAAAAAPSPPASEIDCGQFARSNPPPSNSQGVMSSVMHDLE